MHRRGIHEPIMGTFLEVRVTADDELAAARAEDVIVATARDLAARLTVYDAGSELRRWRAGHEDRPGPDLGRLLTLAHGWHARSGGIVHPATSVVTDRWLRAAVDGTVPLDEELDALAAELAVLPYTVVDGRPVRTADAVGVDLNAVAKGYVVDRAADAGAAMPEVHRVVVNAGGDLVHRGDGELGVAVEDPRRPLDGAPPLVRIRVQHAAVATSGCSRRWFEVDGRRHSRVLDPRTARPVDHVAAATVVAPDAATADALATVAVVAAPAETFALLETLRAEAGGGPFAALVIGADGRIHADDAWDALAVT